MQISKLSIALIIIGATFIGCQRKLSKITSLDNDWTLESVPNVIDTIGTVFAIKGKHQRYIATINLKKIGGTGQLPTRNLSKSISVGAMASFLKLKKIDSASVTLSDTSKIVSNFNVSNAYYGRQSDNLLEAFNRQKKIIIDNIEFYGMQDSELFLITEIIKSPSVSIDLGRSNNASIKLKSAVAKIVSIDPLGVQFTNKDSTTLKYNLNESLVIFYKLNPIKINIIGGKDPGSKKEIDLILDERPLKKSELIYQNK